MGVDSKRVVPYTEKLRTIPGKSKNVKYPPCPLESALEENHIAGSAGMGMIL